MGAIVLGSLTAPPPEAAPETTTTSTTDNLDQPIDFENFTVAEIERGTQLDWSQARAVSDGFPLALFEHGGWIYLFATEAPAYVIPDQRGLRAWRSSDGFSWEPLGHVIGADHVVNSIEATEQGLVAIEAGIGGALTLWRSSNGVEWSSEEVVTGDANANTTRYSQAIGGNDHLLVVTATNSVDILGQLEDKLADVMGDDVDMNRLGWGPEFNGDEFSVSVWGPLGFPIIEVTGEELGLTDEEQKALEESWTGSEPGLESWVSVEPGQWHQGELPGASWINSITATPSGKILAIGWDNQSNRVWSTTDGFNWEQTNSLGEPDQLEVWNGILIGARQSGVVDIVTSVDGVKWESIGPSDYLPYQLGWNIGAMASGQGGIAATLQGWSSSTFAQPGEPVVLDDGGATLTIDYSTGSYQVEAGEMSRMWSMSSSTKPDGVNVDLVNSAMTFHAETGEELASFTFEELTEAESEYWSASALEDQHEGFVFTPDGENWTIQDTRKALDGSIGLLEVTDSRIVAAVVPSDWPYSPMASPGFEIWSAPIP